MLRSPEKPLTSKGATAEKLGKWPVTESLLRWRPEEGDEVKEDKEVEANVVEGADSPLDVDKAVPCGSLLKCGKFEM